MPYPAKLLAEGEEIVHETKQHWIALRDEIAYTVVWLVLWVVLVPWLDFAGDEWVVWGLTLAWLIRVAFGVARWYSTDLIFTTRRLIYRAGVLEKSGYEVRASGLVDVGFKQSFLQRLVGAGDLLVDSDAHAKTVIRDVPDPIGLSVLMEKKTEGEDQTRGQLPGESTLRAATASSSQSDRAERTSSKARLTRAEQLEILARLHTDGKLTDEEFILEKRRVLESD